MTLCITSENIVQVVQHLATFYHVKQIDCLGHFEQTIGWIVFILFFIFKSVKIIYPNDQSPFCNDKLPYYP